MGEILNKYLGYFLQQQHLSLNSFLKHKFDVADDDDDDEKIDEKDIPVSSLLGSGGLASLISSYNSADEDDENEAPLEKKNPVEKKVDVHTKGKSVCLCCSIQQIKSG